MDKQLSDYLGTPEHKAQYCAELIKSYYENIWTDEMQRSRKQVEEEYWRKELAGIESKIERKEFKTKNEGDKAKFVAERELKMVTDKIIQLTEKITKTWPNRIKEIEEYMEKDQA